MGSGPLVGTDPKLHMFRWSYIYKVRPGTFLALNSFLYMFIYADIASVLQWAAMRHDLFDPRVCVQLSKLQSTTRPHSWRETKAILNRILGEQWEDILQLTEDSMIGSGCVAQVYKGRLRESTGYGTQQKEVAVKVLHPGIRRSMELDLALMVSAAHAGEWVGQLLLPLLAGKGHAAEGEVNTLQAVPLRCISLLESVAEFSGFMLSQLDLTHEAEALERLR